MIGTPPGRIAFTVGSLEISWYGLLATIALAAAYSVAYALWKRGKDSTANTRDFDRTALIVLITGVIGARALFVLYHFDYFVNAPSEIIAFWHGGWVWHGGLIGGAIALFFCAGKSAKNFLLLADLFAPALALAQSIGRWGNYFNQEAYGLPTSAWWGIPIDPANRVAGFEATSTFHPTFLYESVADIALFAFLLALSLRKNTLAPGVIAAIYLIIYSAIRFGIEFFRIDLVPVFLGLRAPQWISAGMIIFVGWQLLQSRRKKVY